jgi:uncharacterized protein (DUF1330 family)
MAVYAIAQMRFTDREAYNRYMAGFMEVFQNYSGRVLANDESPQLLEGESDREKIVILEFPDEAEFRSWAGSPEYQEIAKDRYAGADSVVHLVQGL